MSDRGNILNLANEALGPRSAPESRVKCWKCGKKVRLRKDGTLGAHGADPAWLAGVGEFLLPHCDATGKKP